MIGSSSDGVARRSAARKREELVHPERFGDVVVGTGVERRHLVGLGVTHGEHDDRDRAPPAQPADDIHTVDTGKPEVEHDDIGMVTRREVERVLAVGREVDVVAARAG